MDARALELKTNLDAVTARIQRASTAAGRTPPKLIVVTKYHPAADVRRLVDLGVRDVGENRDQEAAGKAAAVAGDVDAAGLRWHFIGQLQTNKAKSVVRYAHSVHSVDRVQLVRALGRAMAAQQDADGRADLQCFIQVNLDPAAGGPAATAGVGRGGEGTTGAAGRGGALPADIPALAELTAATPGLVLAGLMAVAPLGADPAAAFARLAELSVTLRETHPGAGGISAGMSHDLEQAVAAGATHLRVGSDVLGPRPAVL